MCDFLHCINIHSRLVLEVFSILSGLICLDKVLSIVREGGLIIGPRMQRVGVSRVA